MFKAIVEKLATFVGVVIGSLIYAVLTGTFIWLIWRWVQPVFFPSLPAQFHNPGWVNTFMLIWLIEELGVIWRGKRD